MAFLLLILFTFALSWLLVNRLCHLLQNHLVDIPNSRSSHTQPTPSAGGLGFATAFAIATPLLPILTPTLNPIPTPLWLALIPLALISLIDDYRDLSISLRFTVQLITALVVVYQCGPFPMPWLQQLGPYGNALAFGLTVIGFLSLVNFYNFMDGLDGIVGGVTAIQLSFLALWHHQPQLWLAVASLLGFLYWNWAPARIFMGDIGSTLLGAVVAIALLYPAESVPHAWAALPILLPLMADALYTIASRLWRRENIFQAHRRHISQRLQQSGWCHSRVAIVYILATSSVALSLWQFTGAPLWVLATTPLAIALSELYLAWQPNRDSYEISLPGQYISDID